MGLAVYLIFEEEELPLSIDNHCDTLAHEWQVFDEFGKKFDLIPLIELIDWDPEIEHDKREYHNPVEVLATIQALEEASTTTLADQFAEETRDRLKEDFEMLIRELGKAIDFGSNVALAAL